MPTPSPDALTRDPTAVRPAQGRRRRPVGSAVVDVVLVIVFAAIGRASHQEAHPVLGVVDTAWPFLVGTALGWLLSRAWRTPVRLWPTGVVVWVATVVGGMLLRTATGDGTAVAFVVVATVTLAVFLLGWRAVVALIRRFSSRGAGSSPKENPL
ncbi:hypothetical protein GCM10011512_07440 [Tersicoccus solisilvae]|uniref:DUF3054 domain-containing protein n=1 Tax=Tersicoccus solisilvae TaxID=1882339 RepID=A0ABQ1NYI7_9MICC|nr:DUF3054 domain-containing protein [Tersicoccus solisilvae]GGC83198.1 hypothetical protein GCM10011512_07440 [Tersicoccus solisilvae]